MPMPLRQAALALLLVASGCDLIEVDGETADATVTSATAPPSAPVQSPPDCTICDEVDVDGGCMTADGCHDWCEVQPAWSADVADAFAECVLTDPLCFISLEDCMWEMVDFGSGDERLDEALEVILGGG
jgi:hypothetical protein